MSGDVQARKRKEKKRKKDEEDSVAPPPTLGNISENLADNISIHIYKESNTGGHWCARIIFFIVLAILVGLLGVVIIEHRGNTDISTPLESSQWAFIFDGWVDDSLSSTDEEPHGGDHEKVVQIEKNEEKSDENTEEKIAETQASAEKEVQEEDESLIESAEQKDEIAEDEATGDEIREDESGKEQRQIFLNKEELIRELEFEDSKQEEDVLDNEENSEQNFDDNDVLEEIYSISKDKNSEEETVTYETDSDFEEIVEMPMNENKFEKFLDIPGVNEVNDDNIDPLEEVESIEPEEYVSDMDEKPEIEEIEEESTSVAMKFGVGVALVVAAHFVLVKRWNNEEQENARQSKGETACITEAKKETKLLNDMVRIKKSNNDKAVEGSVDQIRGCRGEEEEEHEAEEEYVEEEVEVEDIEERGKHGNNKRDQRELKEHEKKEKNLKQKDEIKIGPKEMSEEVSEEEEEEEEEVSEEEEEGEKEEEEEEKEDDDYEEEEYDEEEEDDDEIDNFDDSELVAKLEAKYGKLQTTQDDADKDSEHEMEMRCENLVKYKHNK